MVGRLWSELWERKTILRIYCMKNKKMIFSNRKKELINLFLKFKIEIHFFIFVCVFTHVHLWRSEDNLQDLILSSTLWALAVEL